MVDPSDLRDLPPGRFGEVVATVFEHAWDGDVDVSPPSPGGAVDAVIDDGDRERLLHARQAASIDADAIVRVSELASEREFDSVTLVTTGTATGEARAAAADAGVELVDGDAFAELVAEAGVDVAAADQPSVATVVGQLAGHWPGQLREVAVELAASIDEVAAFDRELTRGSGLADVDFLRSDGGHVVARMRFTRTSLLVYVRRGDAMESVVRLTANQNEQPSVRELESDVVTALEGVLENSEE